MKFSTEFFYLNVLFYGVENFKVNFYLNEPLEVKSFTIII